MLLEQPPVTRSSNSPAETPKKLAPAVANGATERKNCTGTQDLVPSLWQKVYPMQK
ncbi:hypothetical protein DPMN_122542 [Dreissena polymorpha]|uniref:Uncharacterized protein n=1 Tax=Dreissena polymorpha TaxID=45954 RepID=A0A9D4GPW1_DREPO|nr:hypothetical protein DPMN_122542 [Dreissena polymorpha]